MKRSVVTGGSGFLGSHLCERLLAEGHEVVCLDNLDTGSLQNIEHIRDEAFEFRNVDVTDDMEVDGRVDYVFHLASPASPDRLPAPAAAHAQGRLLRHAPRPRPRKVQARPVRPGVHLRGVRRPDRAPAA